jgi:MFS family permease
MLSFLVSQTFPKTEDPNVGGITVAIYEIGCLFGAIGAILWGDKMGRKTTILLGMFIMVVGTISESALFRYERRVLTFH